MDLLMEDMHTYFVNCSHSEVMSIIKATDILVKNSLQELLNESEQFKAIEVCNHVGSMSEETRVWTFKELENQERVPVIEFDFVASVELNRTTNMRATKSCDGHFRIYDQTDFDPTLISNSFKEELQKAVDNLCECDFDHRTREILQPNVMCPKCSAQAERMCQKCCVSHDNGRLAIVSKSILHRNLQCSLVFLWTSEYCRLIAKDCLKPEKEEIVLNKVLIEVDVLPTYTIDVHDKQNHLTRDKLLVVPKPCHACNASVCWRLSYALKETEIVRSTTESHRSVYMAIKVFINVSFPSGEISTYMLKTAFLRHIDDCDGKGRDMIDCFSNILHILSVCFELNYLENFFTRCNLLEKYRYKHTSFVKKLSLGFENLDIIVHKTVLLCRESATLKEMYVPLRNILKVFPDGEPINLYDYFENLKTKKQLVEQKMSGLKVTKKIDKKRSDTKFTSYFGDMPKDTHETDSKQETHTVEIYNRKKSLDKPALSNLRPSLRTTTDKFGPSTNKPLSHNQNSFIPKKSTDEKVDKAVQTKYIPGPKKESSLSRSSSQKRNIKEISKKSNQMKSCQADSDDESIDYRTCLNSQNNAQQEIATEFECYLPDQRVTSNTIEPKLEQNGTVNIQDNQTTEIYNRCKSRNNNENKNSCNQKSQTEENIKDSDDDDCIAYGNFFFMHPTNQMKEVKEIGTENDCSKQDVRVTSFTERTHLEVYEKDRVQDNQTIKVNSRRESAFKKFTSPNLCSSSEITSDTSGHSSNKPFMHGLQFFKSTDRASLGSISTDEKTEVLVPLRLFLNPNAEKETNILRGTNKRKDGEKKYLDDRKIKICVIS